MSDRADPISSRLSRAGRAHFGGGWVPDLLVRAPGRIEVIGNHVDYNGGPVLAAAIDRQIHFGSAAGGDYRLRIVFADQQDELPVTLLPDELLNWRLDGSRPAPADYVRGVIASLLGRGLLVRTGRDLVVAGNLPPGLGISSSAALCVGLTILLAESRPADGELVLIAQEAEHRVGSPCGTMDQSASVAGGLVAYSGADNSVSTVSADLGDRLFVVINSGVERNLATSSYPDRVREARAALTILREEGRPDLTHLAELRTDDLLDVERIMQLRREPTLSRRVRHVVTESQRVRQAVDAIEQRDWAAVGRLMTASGESSSRDYEISHPAVGEIVRICLGVEGVVGARMMGGGEGGAALALIHRDAVDELGAAMDRGYFELRGLGHLEPKVVACTFARGAGIADGSAMPGS